jgi:chemotaxis protein CheD
MDGIGQARAGRTVVVHVADIKVSSDPGDELVTYALGSCIAVVLYDPIRKVGGMIHYMLPLSQISPEKAAANPAMFADTGVPLLFESVYAAGGKKSDLVVKVVGGGAPLGDNSMFQIGQRNYTVLRKMLWKSSVLIAAEEVGGNVPRTVRLQIATGRVVVQAAQQEREL